MSRSVRTRYVIAYDVADDGKRTRLAALLLDLGDRVQKSVFEADLDPAEVEEILEKSSKYLSSQDSLRLYPLCASCRTGVKTRGHRTVEWLPSGARIV